MSDELIISGGGSVIVASDTMRAQADMLRAVARELDAAADSARRAHAIVTPAQLRVLSAPAGAFVAETYTVSGLVALSRAATRADTLSWALDLAMEGYGRADAFVEKLTQGLTARLGYYLGYYSPVLLLATVALLGHAAAGAVIGGLIVGMTPKQTARWVSGWLDEHRDVLTDPTTVALLRAVIGGSDDAAGGALRIPAVVLRFLGDEGLGVLGLKTSAAVVATLGSQLGLMPRTPVTVAKTGTAGVDRPTGVADRIDRIPNRSGKPFPGQVSVERYPQPDGSAHFEVFIAGTDDFSLSSDTEPFDMSSNIQGIAGLQSASLEAVQTAMAEAGVTADSPVVFTGYSQGGLVASLLAASGEYTVDAVVTVGSPSGLVAVPEDIPLLTIRHTDDIIPAAGGYDASPHAVLVERHLFEDREIPTKWTLPAHQLHYYRETAELVDAARSRPLNDALDVLSRFGEDSHRGLGSTYLATRTAEDE